MAARKTTKTTAERLERLVDKSARRRERLRQTLIEKVGVDVRTWRPKKLTPAELRRELREANAEVRERQKEQHDGLDRLLRLDDVKKMTGLGKTTIWRLERAKQFPRRVRLAGARGRAVAWRLHEVARWIAARTT